MEQTALHWVGVLALGTLLVALCQRLSLSPILGYLATGVLAGPAVLAWVHNAHAIRTLADVGVVLLMFTIGLEFSLSRLLSAKRMVLGLGSAQVVSTAAVVGILCLVAGLTVVEAFIVGAALAMSSTAIVLKQLGEQMELPTPHGRIVTAILLFQDLAAVPILVVLPVLAQDPDALGQSLAIAMTKGALVFGGLLLAGRYILPPLLHWVAQTRSLELFMLVALLLALSAAGLSVFAGLSPTLGAFMAGMLLGETEFRHQVEADIRPFRDLMLGLFFVSIGIHLDPNVFVESPWAITLVAIIAVFLKPALLYPLIRAFGHQALDATRASMALAQGGEFGLLLVSQGMALGLSDTQVAQPVLGGVIVSMALAPVLLRFNQVVGRALVGNEGSSLSSTPMEQLDALSHNFSGHVIVCGYGRLGQNVVRLLTGEGIDTLALDLDPERIRQAAASGEAVVFANAAQPDVLRTAGLDRAAALAITFDDSAVAEQIVSHARHLGFTGPILVRSVHGRDDATLVTAGATVFPEGLETSLAFAGQLMVMLDIPPSRVEARLNAIRAEDYAPLKIFFHDSDLDKAHEQALDYPRTLRSIVIRDGHRLVGHTPEELGLEHLGVRLVSVQRGPIRVPGNLLDTHLRSGDVLVLEGSPEALDKVFSIIER